MTKLVYEAPVGSEIGEAEWPREARRDRYSALRKGVVPTDIP